MESNEKKERVKILKPLYLSDGFKDILNRIIARGKSNVAERFLEWENDGKHEFDSTFIDRTDADDVVTFIQAPRVQRFEDDGGDIKNGWDVKGRAETRIGRLIRRLFGTRFDQKSIEVFVNKYKAVVRAEKALANFEVVRGDDIAKWYLYSKYVERRGTLGGSCMQGNECQRYFGIYTQNPNQVSLCILKNDKGDKIKGRALLWNLSSPKDLIFMDRIYTNDDADVNLFVEYAKQQGWTTKARQSYRGDDLVLPDGGDMKDVKMKVVLDDVNFNRYPYMDTLRHFYRESRTLSNVYLKDLGECWTLNDTGGYYDEYDGEYEPIYVQDWEGNEINEDEAVWCEYEEVWCLRDDATYISKGEHGRGKYFPPNTKLLVYSEYSDSKYHKDDVIYSDYMKDNVYKKYAVKMYLDKDKKKWVWTHRLTLHDDMGKVGDDYFINDILYRDQKKNEKGKIVPGEYHFKDEEFESLPIMEDPDDDYFAYVPSDVQLDK